MYTLAIRHVVCHIDELPPGARKIVEVGSRSIGVFNLEGSFYALRNQCPHQLAPLCQGAIVRKALPSRPREYVYEQTKEIIRCPWHGWEFDIKTGQSVFNPHRLRVKSYEVRVEPPDGSVDKSADGSAESSAEGSAGGSAEGAAEGATHKTEHSSDEDPFVETYSVHVEKEFVILYV